LISFLSRGTTLPPGTTIVTGTPYGVGMGTKDYLNDGEEIAIEIMPYIGTLITRYETEK
jgi:2-keto-4-pentenoate hydratase/2-oxohepta-3-ene-1,7-dioic acid hydratase in catechol pathway